MKDSIRLDTKHGLNPGLLMCFFCQKPRDVALWGQIAPETRQKLIQSSADVGNDGEAPTNLVTDLESCPDSTSWMQKGVILISCRDPDENPELKELQDYLEGLPAESYRARLEAKRRELHCNPYRTGGWAVVLQDVLTKRFCFVPDEVWDLMGLPRGDVEDESDDG
jgi:hypothetical protein